MAKSKSRALRRIAFSAAGAVMLSGSCAFAADEAQLAVAENTELAAVTSPRQAGSADFNETKAEEHKPLTFEVTYKADLLAGLSGSWRDKGAYLGNLDLKFTVAGEQAFKLPGSTVFIHVLNNHGGKPNERVGSTQGVDNIEVDVNTTKILQAWYQQQWLDDRWSLLVGLYDLNSEFYVTDSSATFIHPSFGIGAELAQTGLNGPSIFPTTSLGLRLRWQATPAFYAQAVVLDGVPGDPRDPNGTQVRFDKGDGTLSVLEVGHARNIEGALSKFALGAWRYSSRFDDLRDTGAAGEPLQRVNSGFYVLAQRSLYRPAGEPERGLNGFVRLGSAQAHVNQLDFSAAFGAAYTGLLAQRPEDVFGFGVAAVKNGSKFRDVARANGELAPSWEIAYEITYRAQLKPWLALQPVLEYVSYSGDAQAKNATIAGLRLEANY